MKDGSVEVERSEFIPKKTNHHFNGGSSGQVGWLIMFLINFLEELGMFQINVQVLKGSHSGGAMIETSQMCLKP